LFNAVIGDCWTRTLNIVETGSNCISQHNIEKTSELTSIFIEIGKLMESCDVNVENNYIL
jgi:hypothetical protein